MRHLKPKSMLIAFAILSIFFITMFTMMGSISYSVKKANIEMIERVK